MSAQTHAHFESEFPRHAYKAGFWLVLTFPLVILVAYPLEMWVHRQSLQNIIQYPLLLAIFGWTAYQWASALVRRSGLGASRRAGLAAAIALPLTIFGMFPAYDLVFGTAMKLLNVTQTVRGTRPEFLVVFVLWTGIVTGGCGFAVGLALKRWALALKLLALGLVSGAAVFLSVALAMEALGFRVGTPRPDGLPSMPIVTLLGIWSTALIGSALYGWVLARDQ